MRVTPMLDMIVHCKRDQFDVYVGRPSPWGNPFTVAQHGRGTAIQQFERWVRQPEQKELRNRARRELPGMVLGCWCAPRPCHAATWIQIAAEQME